MTDIEMVDTSSKKEEPRKVEKEPDDQYYGKLPFLLKMIRAQKVARVDGEGGLGT